MRVKPFRRRILYMLGIPLVIEWFRTGPRRIYGRYRAGYVQIFPARREDHPGMTGFDTLIHELCHAAVDRAARIPARYAANAEERFVRQVATGLASVLADPRNRPVWKEILALSADGD